MFFSQVLVGIFIQHWYINVQTPINTYSSRFYVCSGAFQSVQCMTSSVIHHLSVINEILYTYSLQHPSSYLFCFFIIIDLRLLLTTSCLPSCCVLMAVKCEESPQSSALHANVSLAISLFCICVFSGSL